MFAPCMFIVIFDKFSCLMYRFEEISVSIKFRICEWEENRFFRYFFDSGSGSITESEDNVKYCSSDWIGSVVSAFTWNLLLRNGSKCFAQGSVSLFVVCVAQVTVVGLDVFRNDFFTYIVVAFGTGHDSQSTCMCKYVRYVLPLF